MIFESKIGKKKNIANGLGLVLFFIFIYFFVALDMMLAATTSATNAGTGADVAGVGTVTWLNPSRIVANDNSYASAAVNGATSHYLQATNYGFNIPAGATISGIQVTIGRYGSTGFGSDVRDSTVRLIKAGAVTGNNKAVTTTDWTGIETAVVYGGAADLWGTTWTPADINVSNFGVALSVNSNNNRTAFVDYMQITVTYTVPTVSSVNTSHADGSFTAGEIIDLSVIYSDTVNVVGSPVLALNSGGTANYLSGSGSNTLIFRYSVLSGESSSDLTYTSTNALTLPGGATIKDIVGNDVTNTLPAPTIFSGAHAIIIDTTAPSATSDLALSGATTSSIDLDWTSSGDDGNSGTASTYDVRYSTSAITELNWSLATQATGEPTPSVAGTSESMTVSGLTQGTTYYFAIKTSDEVPNASSISNVPSLGTTEDEPMAPDNVTLGNLSESSGGVKPTIAEFFGLAYPGATIEILRKDNLNPDFRNVPFKNLEVLEDGTFKASLVALLQGEYFFGLRGIDKKGRKTGIMAFSANFVSINELKAEDLFLPPTIFLKEKIVSRGGVLRLEGYAAPESLVEIFANKEKRGEIKADATGIYSYDFKEKWEAGNYEIKTRQIDKNKRESQFSLTEIFRVSSLENPRADFNNDNKINLTDWSVFLFRWGSKETANRKLIDLNEDGLINMSDFSLFLRAVEI
ncbi:MAG: fibronectin type III domain-containing protein [Candidatus Pacebacteria bacterium]|nr:fibronectin type III domain-containing protein [Candidatus Paceibacterota bacterium]